MKKLTAVFMAVIMAMSISACSQTNTTSNTKYENETDIVLSDNGITVDGNPISTDENEAVYTANDIIYYEDKDTYDDGLPYGAGSGKDKHTREEAQANTVVHITKAGTYRISGTLSAGQIAVDLGEDAKTNPDAVVTLVMDGVDITCTVAPGVIFYSVYECNTEWVAYDEGEAENYDVTETVDTSRAGANVIIADGTVNTVNGSYVAKVYKDKEGEKKLYKFDGAFYSKMSMNINGESEGTGVLNIIAANEGLDSEMHLTISGGKISIQSQDDGINTNEDGVSVTTINGGELHIVAGLGSEGDGIDSNGYLVINGGVVISSANPASDSGLDSDMGSYINGGTVIALGSTMDWAESDSDQVTMNVQFASMQSSDESLVITDTEGNVVFAYDPDKDETTGQNTRRYQGAIISCAGLEVGGTYYLYVGGDVEGTETDGVYDPSTVTSFTGTRQCYSGNTLGGMWGQRPNGNFNPDNMQMPENGTGTMGRPDGKGQMFDGVTENEDGTITVSEEAATAILERINNTDVTAEELMACTTLNELMKTIGMDNMNGDFDGKREDFDPSQKPDGENTGRPANVPEGMQPSDGGAPQFPDNNMTPPDAQSGATNTTQSGERTCEFVMTDKVNAFSNVQDEQ